MTSSGNRKRAVALATGRVFLRASTGNDLALSILRRYRVLSTILDLQARVLGPRLFGYVSDFERTDAIAGVEQHHRDQKEQTQGRSPAGDGLGLHGKKRKNTFTGYADWHEMAQVKGDAHSLQ